MFRTFLAGILCLVSSVAAWAQDEGRAILVLDASGSMWGQIDGVAKITIAQDVIGGLLQTLPAGQELGLTAYGHRRKGDCSDIETLIAPGTDRDAIAAAVNAIKPRGKTPLSAAVIQAAEALKYTEEAATVILVSDGIETCEFDPCAVGRELESLGVNFTTHVIGFDVSDPAARAQLQCLAEETGGTFRTADNAAELADALQVVAEPEPEPEPVEVIFRATDGEGGPEISENLIWSLGTDAAGLIHENQAAGRLSETLLQGSGLVEVLRTSDEATAEAMFTVGDTDMVVTLVLPEFTPAASLTAPESAPAGSLVAVTWSGPGGQHDFISSADTDMRDGYYHHYTYTRDSEDDVVMLRLPPEAGSYQLRYVTDKPRKVIALREITVTPIEIGFDVADSAAAGATIPLGWTGPDYKNDFITVAALDQGPGYYVNYEYTREGNPMMLQMPPEPGTYEIRYLLGESRHVAGKTTIEVTDVDASLVASDTAAAGETLPVTWEGPDYPSDFISVAEIGSRDNKYLAYTYTRDGSPAGVKMPLEPGEYELRYVVNQDHTVLARKPVSVEAVLAKLSAPASAAASSKITVEWTGPGYQNDYISVAEIGARPNKYEAYTYTRDGSPLSLQMPTQPGVYEIRYVASGNTRDILARVSITVEAVGAELKADDTAPAGSELLLTWTGPGGQNDYISVAEPGERPNKYEAYTYTREGSPLRLQMPTEPGEYELRYVVSGTERDILVRRPITVTEVQAVLEADAAVPAGSQLLVTWEGPGYNNDYLSIAVPGERANKYETYTYTRDGSPLRVQVPAEPGEYELRYVVSGTERAVLTTIPLTVDPVTAALKAPGTAQPGENLTISWQGPDYRGDYIAISEPGDKGYESYTRTSDGSPLIVKVPDKPGDYEIRYVMNQERTVLATLPLTVE